MLKTTTATPTNRYITSSYLLENRGTFSEVINILGENLLPTIFDSKEDESARMTGWKFKEFLSNRAIRALRQSFSQREANELLDLQTALLSSNQITLQAICQHLDIDFDYLQKDEDRFDVTGIKVVLTEILKHLVNTAIENIAVVEVEDDKAGPHVHIQAVRSSPNENNDEKMVIALPERSAPEEIDPIDPEVRKAIQRSEEVFGELESLWIGDLPDIEDSCNSLYEIASFLHAQGYLEETLGLYTQLLSSISAKVELEANCHYSDDSINLEMRVNGLRYLDVQHRNISVIADGIQKALDLDRGLQLRREHHPELNHQMFEIPVVLKIIAEFAYRPQVAYNHSAFFCSSMRLPKQRLKCRVDANFLGEAHRGLGVTTLLTRLRENNEPSDYESPGTINFNLYNIFTMTAFDNNIWVQHARQSRVIVFSLTDRITFEWVKKVFGSNTNPMLLVGTKKDLVNDQQVSFAEIEDFARSIKVPSICVSATTGENIEELKNILFSRLMETQYPVPQPTQADDGQASQADDGAPPPSPPPQRCVVM